MGPCKNSIDTSTPKNDVLLGVAKDTFCTTILLN